MAAYLLRRLWQTIPTLAGVILLVFVLFKFFGGDPAEILAGQIAKPDQIAAIRQQLGLDQPWWIQLWIFVKQVLTFDWGRSWATNEAVSNLFLTRLPACAPSITASLPIRCGIRSGRRPSRSPTARRSRTGVGGRANRSGPAPSGTVW